MGIRSNVGIALVGVALKKKVIEGLSESVKKIFSEADDCLEHKEGSLYIFRDIKWYIETDVEIVTLYDALRDIKNDDYLIVVACHESSKMGDSGGWFNNPWGLCEEIRIIYDASV